MALSLGALEKHNLGWEVEARSSTEERYAAAWDALNAGNPSGAVTHMDALLDLDANNEKCYYTRAVAHARLSLWGYAVADYSRYLRLVQMKSGAALANARYGRALCLKAGPSPSGAARPRCLHRVGA